MNASRLNWKEVEEITAKKQVIIIPIGSTEQHGLHLPLETDAIIAREATEKVCAKYRILRTPTIHFSLSQEHRDFPGTIFLKKSTLRKLLADVCASLARHGFKKIVLFNTHGGNDAFLKKFRGELERDCGAKVFLVNSWDFIEGGDHAGEVETSLMLFLEPKLVKKKNIVDERPAFFRKNFKKIEDRKVSWKKYTESGVAGKPSTASAKKGKKFFAQIVEGLEEKLKEIEEA
jgi:creatinine amidohydrolase